MTDKEIIKALGTCNKNGSCSKCPYDRVRFEAEQDCVSEMTADALDLINRQQAEIGSLNEQERILIYHLAFEREKAIKEFAERLKTRLHTNAHVSPFANNLNDVIVDNLVKEMTGETKPEKCDCFCEEQRIKGWLDGNTPITEPITVCNGTRERDECTCGGDKSKCDFYEKDYSYGY